MRTAFNLSSQREAEELLSKVTRCVEETLLAHIGEDGYTLKLLSLGKLRVKHRGGKQQKVAFAGKVITTKRKRKVTFVPLGPLRKKSG